MSRLSIGKWGPVAWDFLHTIAFAYPTEPTLADKCAMHDFIVAFAAVIPCIDCRHHFQEMVTRDVHGPSSSAFDTRESISRLTVAWHNRVNMRLGKRLEAYETVYARYYPRPRASFPAWWMVAAVAVLMVLGTGLANLPMRRKRKN